MKYFVTGATGFIGGELARQLRQQGHEVSALVRTPARAGALLKLGVKIIEGDLEDGDALRAGMRGVDGIFHLAAWYKVGVRDKTPAAKVNIDGTRNVLQAMLDVGVARGVYTSTIGVNSDTHGNLVDETYCHRGPWLTEYERTKWVAHYEVAAPMIADGLPLIIVQPGLVYGPGDQGPTHDFLVDYLRRRLSVAPKGTAFSWGHVVDTAQGHILAMERGQIGESYILAGPSHTMIEALEILRQLTGIPLPRLQPGARFVRSLSRLMSCVEVLRELPTMYASETLRSIAGATYIASFSKAQKDLGYAPRALLEGLRETAEREMQELEGR